MTVMTAPKSWHFGWLSKALFRPSAERRWWAYFQNLLDIGSQKHHRDKMATRQRCGLRWWVDALFLGSFALWRGYPCTGLTLGILLLR